MQGYSCKDSKAGRSERQEQVSALSRGGGCATMARGPQVLDLLMRGEFTPIRFEPTPIPAASVFTLRGGIGMTGGAPRARKTAVVELCEDGMTGGIMGGTPRAAVAAAGWRSGLAEGVVEGAVGLSSGAAGGGPPVG